MCQWGLSLWGLKLGVSRLLTNIVISSLNFPTHFGRWLSLSGWNTKCNAAVQIDLCSNEWVQGQPQLYALLHFNHKLTALLSFHLQCVMWLKSMCSEFLLLPWKHTNLSCPLLLLWGSLSVLCRCSFPVNGHKRPGGDLSDLFSADWCSISPGLAALFTFWPLVLHWNMAAHWRGGDRGCC